ncbi:hypothetical protein F4777DRAFT_587845 [Nemania sp. FL0916]|nr:hypothetical protein F4777DRAFT_587845 [Nemania sp. FL0916]
MGAIFQEIQNIYGTRIPALKRFQNGERNNGANGTFKGINDIDYEVFVKLPISGRRENEHIGGATWRIGEELDLTNPPMPSEEAFNIYKAQWKTSEHFEKVQEALASVEIPFTVNKVIGIGLGALVLRPRVFERCVYQYTLVSIIRQNFSISSNPFVQHPMYTHRDRYLLDATKFTVLESPSALLDLDGPTGLLGIHAGLPLKGIVIDTCRPGIIIWDGEVFNANSHFRSYLSYSPRARKMIEDEYHEVAFPSHESFNNQVMLIRKSDPPASIHG